MTEVRILHVDDENDIREVVEISLGLDPAFVTRSCRSGEEAIEICSDWKPDLILLDVMMPIMDGPTTLLRLRGNQKTVNIPVVFMTARAQARELDRFLSLGVVGIIPKPFDPMTLAAVVRSYVADIDPLDELRKSFLERFKRDIGALEKLRELLPAGTEVAARLAEIRNIAHGLAGAGGIFGFSEISNAAAALEEAVIDELKNPSSCAGILSAYDRLILQDRGVHV